MLAWVRSFLKDLPAFFDVAIPGLSIWPRPWGDKMVATRQAVSGRALHFVLEVARKRKNYAKSDPMNLGFLVIDGTC